MNENSVRLIDPELAAHLENATNMQLRAAALAAGKFAVHSTGISSPVIDQALERLESGKYSDPKLEKELEALVNRLDEIQWSVQDEVEQGKADKEAYSAAFNRARAANAVYAAFNSDAFLAAANSIYEAYYATDQSNELKKVLLSLLSTNLSASI